MFELYSQTGRFFTDGFGDGVYMETSEPKCVEKVKYHLFSSEQILLLLKQQCIVPAENKS